MLGNYIYGSARYQRWGSNAPLCSWKKTTWLSAELGLENPLVWGSFSCSCPCQVELGGGSYPTPPARVLTKPPVLPPRAQGASCPSRACHSSQKCLFCQKSPSGNTHPAANAGGQPGKATLWLIYPDPQNILGLRGGTSGTRPHGCGAEEDESVLLSPSPAPFQGLWNTGIQEPSACLAAEAK